jgi:hypothetical protein
MLPVALTVSLFTVAAAGCRSMPTHYYTLVPRPTLSSTHLGTLQAKIEVAKVPASVDRLQLVVHHGNEISILENHEWIAPLSNEIETALSLELIRLLKGDSNDDPSGDNATWFIRVNVLQLEAYPADRVSIAASWSAKLQSPSQVPAFTCLSQVSESIHPGIDAMVEGYRSLISIIAERMAASMRAHRVGAGAGDCPQ